MELLIAGDLVPTEENEDMFVDGNIKSLMGHELLSIWENADFRLFNLEVPLTDEADPIEKHGPNLLAPTNTINGIKKLRPSLLVLANNHILDQGVNGLYTTLKLLKDNDIDFIGAGKNLCDASKAFKLKKNGFKIGFYSCAEHEFTIASDDKPGANPFDPLESLDHIQELKKESDYVIVLYHGGKEHYRYPSPYLQKVSRKMVQKGADLIICQHSHCIGCYEEYEGSTVIYGQGNFIFDSSDSEYWETSLLVRVTFDKKINVDYIPVVKKGHGVRLATGQVKEDILTGFNRRSREILQGKFIEERYSEFAKENLQSYLRLLSGTGKWMSRLDRKLLNGRVLKRKYNQKKLLALQNAIHCEAHRELLLAGLKGENMSER